MTEDSRHFDAPRTDSITRATVVLLRAHWKIVVALIVNVSILQTMAFGLVGMDAIGTERIEASIASVSIFVAAETEASAAEVDALGPLIRAVPGVSTAALRSKDDAIRSLIASGLPAPDGRNPLPDVWIVRIQAGAVGDGGSVATAWDEKRKALASLPRVASVSTDERWVSTLDRSIARWRREWPTGLSIGLGILSLGAACMSYLAGSGLRARSDQNSARVRMQVLAILSFLVGCASTLIAYSMSWTVIGRLSDASVARASWSYLQLIATRPLVAALTTLAVMFLILAGILAASRKPGE